MATLETQYKEFVKQHPEWDGDFEKWKTHVLGNSLLKGLQILDELRFNAIIEEIRENLGKIKYHGDLSDIGNEIGYVIGKHVSEEDSRYSLNTFNDGVKHGISLRKGIHS